MLALWLHPSFAHEPIKHYAFHYDFARFLEYQATAVQQVNTHMAAAKAIIERAIGKVSSSAPEVPPARKAYISRFVQACEQEGRPSSVAEVAKLIRVKREPLERSVYMEFRKKNPRLKKVGPGKYWLVGRELPKG